MSATTRQVRPEALYVGFRDAVALTSLSRATLYRAASEGRLRIIKIGSRSVIAVSELKTFIEGPGQ